MNRFYCPSSGILGNEIIIKDKQKVRHIAKSLCLKPKEKVIVFDENGFEYLCVISRIEDKVYLEVKEKILPDKNHSRIDLTIACAIPKKAKFDDIVDKLTQLSVCRIIPLITQRVIVKLDRKKKELRLNRWRRIAESASQQSQRHDIPKIDDVQDFKKVILESKNFNLKLIPTLFGERKSIKEALSFIKPSLDKIKILCLIGPEGDFSKEEIDIAKKAGFVPVCLGDLVLRVDTAAIALASCLSFYKR
jgi:16S rRNA (uracil1498-N3)-methyltransferase